MKILAVMFMVFLWASVGYSVINSKAIVTGQAVTAPDRPGTFVQDSNVVYEVFAPYSVLGTPVVMDDRNGVTAKAWLFFDGNNDVSLRCSSTNPSLGSWSATSAVTNTYKTFCFYPVQVGGKWYASAMNRQVSFLTANINLLSFDRLDGTPTYVSRIATANSTGVTNILNNSALFREGVTWIAFFAVGSTNSPWPASIAKSTSTDGVTWSSPANIVTTSIVKDADSQVKWVRFLSTNLRMDGSYDIMIGAGTYTPSFENEDRDAKVYYCRQASLLGAIQPYYLLFSCTGVNPFIDNAYAPTPFYDTVSGRYFIYSNSGPYGSEKIVRLERQSP